MGLPGVAGLDMANTLVPTWPPILFVSSIGKSLGGGKERVTGTQFCISDHERKSNAHNL